MWLAGSKPQEQEVHVNTIAAQITALQTLPAAQLAARYCELFGRPPRVMNAAWLRRQCAWKLQEQQLGGLSDRARTRLDELVAGIDLPLGTNAPRPRPEPLRPESPAPMIVTV